MLKSIVISNASPAAQLGVKGYVAARRSVFDHIEQNAHAFFAEFFFRLDKRCKRRHGVARHLYTVYGDNRAVVWDAASRVMQRFHDGDRHGVAYYEQRRKIDASLQSGAHRAVSVLHIVAAGAKYKRRIVFYAALLKRAPVAAVS